ncbi:MAG: hypothetical protein IKW21_05235 [Lachnospiraceae bacterium]|nr:hypothetical protein [Lachnospiraceae bacterium]
MGKKKKDKKPLEITHELALSAARVLKGYCKDKKNCIGCVFKRKPIHEQKIECDVGFPCTWILPGRSEQNGTSD